MAQHPVTRVQCSRHDYVFPALHLTVAHQAQTPQCSAQANWRPTQLSFYFSRLNSGHPPSLSGLSPVSQHTLWSFCDHTQKPKSYLPLYYPVSWWWTGRPGVLGFMGLQIVGHDWATELTDISRCLDLFPVLGCKTGYKEVLYNTGTIANIL